MFSCLKSGYFCYRRHNYGRISNSGWLLWPRSHYTKKQTRTVFVLANAAINHFLPVLFGDGEGHLSRLHSQHASAVCLNTRGTRARARQEPLSSTRSPATIVVTHQQFESVWADELKTFSQLFERGVELFSVWLFQHLFFIFYFIFNTFFAVEIFLHASCHSFVKMLGSVRWRVR